MWQVQATLKSLQEDIRCARTNKANAIDATAEVEEISTKGMRHVKNELSNGDFFMTSDVS
jgi:hypothetical protein